MLYMGPTSYKWPLSLTVEQVGLAEPCTEFVQHLATSPWTHLLATW